MAFIITFTAPKPAFGQRHVTPVCMGRNNSSRSRRPKQSSRRHTPTRTAQQARDPLLYDNDIDTTDITTYFSCPHCFNSIMLRPEQLLEGPLRVTCNCCEKKCDAQMSDLENVDGSEFDYLAWRKQYCTPGMQEEYEATMAANNP